MACFNTVAYVDTLEEMLDFVSDLSKNGKAFDAHRTTDKRYIIFYDDGNCAKNTNGIVES